MPKELIATFEVLWQTAMEYAEQQMSDIKAALKNQEEKLQQEKILTEKTVADLKLQLNGLSQVIELKTQANQLLQTKLAVADERIERQATETEKIEQQYELRLKHFLDEKHLAIEKIDQLQTEVSQLRLDLSDQDERHQSILTKERELQQDSEKRWAQLIDQARSEARSWRKKYDDIVRTQSDRTESLQNNLVKLQDNLTAVQTTVNHKNDVIDELNKQLEKVRGQHTATVGELAVMKAKSKTTECRKSNNGPGMLARKNIKLQTKL